MELVESSMLTTYNIQFGRYRCKRIPPDVWQRKMREHIEGLKGIGVIAEDLCLLDTATHLLSDNGTMTKMCVVFSGPLPRKNREVNQEENPVKAGRSSFHWPH